MKKSLLALSAATLVGGLGFVTSAQAIIVSEDAKASIAATKLDVVEPGGVGHILFTPYYSTVNGNTTLISLVNTDMVNGKAIKVRFRGAANSDDVLDFTVLMSPGDVWTASIEPSASGFAKIVSPDTSCVLPRQIGTAGVDFRGFRLDEKLSAEAQAFHTREGYVEFLNMADISSTDGAGTAAKAVPGTKTTLFTSIKHVDNVAPCDGKVNQWLMAAAATDVLTPAQAKDYGLLPPTGQLFGNWSIFNNKSVTSYGGGHAAVRAVDAGGANAAARLFFAPQKGEAVAAGTVAKNTADPLLVKGFAGAAQKWLGKDYTRNAQLDDPVIKALWLDLPDLSTPYTQADIAGAAVAAGDPATRAKTLSQALEAKSIMNEFVATADDAAVPFSTDWVFSQPTRRYQVAMAYSKTSAEKNMPVNVANVATGLNYFVGGNVEVRTTKAADGLALGDVLCATADFSGTNREEFVATTEGDFSPVPVAGKSPICGEVATLTFNRSESKVLHANLTNERVNVKDNKGAFIDAGWATLTLKGADNNGLPVLGYAATAFSNGRTNGNFGDAIGHRYTR